MAFQCLTTPTSKICGRERGKTWVPRSLHPAILVIFILIASAIIILLEELSRISRYDGALASAHLERGFSPTVIFLYQILPTISTVIYSLAWSWMDLDIRRLVPYFPMSKPGDAEVKDSLLLSYPSDFVAAPVRAFRKRSVLSKIRNVHQLMNSKALGGSLVWTHHLDHRGGNHAPYERHILVLKNGEIFHRKYHAVLDNSTTIGPGCSA